MDIKKIALNDFTLTSLPLVMTRGDLRCWGSGFLYFHNNSHHLVTAWHNCSGRNFVDKQPISKDGWVPSHMQIILPLAHPLEAHDGLEYGTFGFTTRLYFDFEEEQPIWLVDAETEGAGDSIV